MTFQVFQDPYKACNKAVYLRTLVHDCDKFVALGTVANSQLNAAKIFGGALSVPLPVNGRNHAKNSSK